MRALRLVGLVGVLLTTGCGDGDGDGDEAGEVDPRSGAWDFSGSGPVDDTCGLEDLYVDNPGAFELTNNGDGSITIVAAETEFDCTLEGSQFECPSRLSGENDIGADFNLDAVVIYNVAVHGSFSSDTGMSGTQVFTIECEGVDCPTLEIASGVDIPCGWEQNFTSSHL